MTAHHALVGAFVDVMMQRCISKSESEIQRFFVTAFNRSPGEDRAVCDLPRVFLQSRQKTEQRPEGGTGRSEGWDWDARRPAEGGAGGERRPGGSARAPDTPRPRPFYPPLPER